MSPADDLTSTTLRNFLSSSDNTPTESTQVPYPNEMTSPTGRRSPALHRVPSPSLNLSTSSRTSATTNTSNSNLQNTLPARTIRPRASMADMSRYDEYGNRRNTPTSSVGLDRERDRERERRVRTLGMTDSTTGSGGRSSPSNTISDMGDDGRWSSRNGSGAGSGSGSGRKDLGGAERSSTSMSSTRRKTDWLEKEYERSRGTPTRESGAVREESYAARRLRAEAEASNNSNSGESRRKERAISPSMSINEDGIRKSAVLARHRPSLPLEFISSTSPRMDRERTLSPRIQHNSLSPRIANSVLSSSISSRTTPPTSVSTRRGSTPDSGVRRYGSQNDGTPTSQNRSLPPPTSLGVPSRFEGDSQEPVDQRTLSRARSSARLRSQMTEAQIAEASRIEKEDGMLFFTLSILLY